MDDADAAIFGIAGCLFSLVVGLILLPFKLLSLIGFKWAFAFFTLCIVVALLLNWSPLHIDPNKVFPSFPIHVDNSTYVITSKTANGRLCPRTDKDCRIVKSFNSGDEIHVLGSMPGEAVKDN